MGWTQFETCKTCQYWKDSYEGCYMHRGGWCDDHSKAYKPLYSIIEKRLESCESTLKELMNHCLDYGVQEGSFAVLMAIEKAREYFREDEDKEKPSEEGPLPTPQRE